jgi:hypothetical protein
MNCTVYMVSCNFAICPLKLMAYKSNELQMSFAIQKLNCKAHFKTPFFSHNGRVNVFFFY